MIITTSQPTTRAQVINSRAQKSGGKQNGFRHDISHYYGKIRFLRTVPYFAHLTVRHEVRAIALFIGDDEFGMHQLAGYLQITEKRFNKFPEFFAYYGANFKARDLQNTTAARTEVK